MLVARDAADTVLYSPPPSLPVVFENGDKLCLTLQPHDAYVRKTAGLPPKTLFAQNVQDVLRDNPGFDAALKQHEKSELPRHDSDWLFVCSSVELLATLPASVLEDHYLLVKTPWLPQHLVVHDLPQPNDHEQGPAARLARVMAAWATDLVVGCSTISPAAVAMGLWLIATVPGLPTHPPRLIVSSDVPAPVPKHLMAHAFAAMPACVPRTVAQELQNKVRFDVVEPVCLLDQITSMDNTTTALTDRLRRHLQVILRFVNNNFKLSSRQSNDLVAAVNAVNSAFGPHATAMERAEFAAQVIAGHLSHALYQHLRGEIQSVAKQLEDAVDSSGVCKPAVAVARATLAAACENAIENLDGETTWLFPLLMTVISANLSKLEPVFDDRGGLRFRDYADTVSSHELLSFVMSDAVVNGVMAECPRIGDQFAGAVDELSAVYSQPQAGRKRRASSAPDKLIKRVRF